MTELGLFTGNPRDALAYLNAAAPASPDTFFRSNLPRVGLTDSGGDASNPALTDGSMTSVPIFLAAGDLITNISVISGDGASGTEANWWFALYDTFAVPGLMAQTADQATADFAVNTVKTLPLATAQRITKSGIYWVGIMMNVSAGAPNSLLGSLVARPVVTGERNLAQVSGAGALTSTAPATIATPTVQDFAPLVVLT